MVAELLLALARCNLAASLAILAVFPLRAPLRRWFGAQHAYAAWLIVPLAAAGSLMPTDFAAGAAGPIEQTSHHMLAWLSADGRVGAITVVWLAGVLAAIAIVARRHAGFCGAMKAGRAGPAATGGIERRLVLPADFEARFTEDERRLVRAHEQAHIDRQDTRYNAAAVVASWACWFNPLLHLAIQAMRRDQELACDATVLDRLPGARRLYAETLLRTHQDVAAPALGCQWRSGPSHPLVARIRWLGSRSPSRTRREVGAAFLLATWAMAFGAAWAAQPPARLPETQTVVLIDLAPPDAATVQQGAAAYRAIETRP